MLLTEKVYKKIYDEIVFKGMSQDEFVSVITKIINAAYDAGVLYRYEEIKKELQE